MVQHYRKNWKTYHIAFIVIILLMSFPNVFFSKAPGLEWSWRYALNRFFCERLIPGKDYVFTYGFLGFLCNCQDVGHNIARAFLFWTGIEMIHGFLLIQLLLKGPKRQNFTTFLGLFLYVISSPLPEYYLIYIALMALLLAMDGFKEDIYIFALLIPTTLYIKFSMFMLMAMIIVLYLVFGYFQDKALYRYCTPKICLGIVAIPVSYFVFFGFSPVNFKNYIRGSLEVASGYNIAMSFSQYNKYIIWIILTAAACAVCLAMSAKCGLHNFMVFAFVSVCLLLVYKHGFVRADEPHVAAGMNAMLTFTSLAVIFLDWVFIEEALGKYKKLYFALFAVMLSVMTVQNGLENVNVAAAVKSRVMDFPLRLETILRQEDKDVCPLSDAMVNEIGNGTVTTYPWDVSYGVSNELNYVPLATIQAYSAYTPYLDRITAEKFLAEDAPEYIILKLKTIEGRWPFIECPQTWEAVRNYYYIVMEEEGIFLLRRDENAVSVSYKELGVAKQNKEDRIDLGDADYIKISAKLNWKGILAKLFWKIPEVKMTVYEDDMDSGQDGRVLMDMLSSGVYVGDIIEHDNEDNIEQMHYVMSHKGELSEISAVALSGEGLTYYQDTIEITFLRTEKEEERNR